MIRKALTAILALLLGLCASSPAFATSYLIFPTSELEVAPSPSPTPQTAVYVEFRSTSSIYKKAGSGHTGIRILKGSVAEAVKLSKNKKWVQILYGPKNNLKGWVRYSRLKKATIQHAAIDYVSSEGASRVSLEEAGAKLTGRQFKTRVTAKVYRSGYSSSSVLGKLKKGRKVTATGKLNVDPSGAIFVQITYSGHTGWVSETSLRGVSAAINRALLR